MVLWKKLWLLFAVIWVAVGALNVFAILALGDNPAEAAVRPLVLLFAVPAAAYVVAWALARRGRGADGGSGKAPR